ncbi:MAG TPA: T9SS type A sorting domain-containing protein [Bacteroidales bacterium]|nr:T9SS type A sorting domain-containing protein [Bacteroidales bacterium]
MKRILNSLVLLFLWGVTALAQEGNLPAFPGAGGFGKYVTGGRGGRVIYVTTLEDNNNEGSLRYAINQSGARIIMFKVGGTIRLTSPLKIQNDNVTIAGQSAPGDGITLRDYTVTIEADNVIIRFIRFRLGDVTQYADDAIWGRDHKNIILDHCSMSWAIDECVSFYDNENFTLQWCIISEALVNSYHSKGPHGYGGIWGGHKVSFHHNLFAHNDSRNPRFCGSRYTNTQEDERVDFRNNVIYNWGANNVYGGEGGRYNMVNNYYKAGPASANRSRIIQPYADDGSNAQPAGTYGKFYLAGNITTASDPVSENNWLGVYLHSSFTSYASGVTKDDIKSDTEFETGEVTTHTASQAFEKVVLFAGACLAQDSVDMRIAHETETGTVTYTDGGNGSTNGLIDTQSAVGGWPVLKTGEAPTDTDEDGMPDSWETNNGLNKNDPGDAQLKTVDGLYPNVEVYINSLVASIIENQNEGGVPTTVSDLKAENEELNIYFSGTSRKLLIHHHSILENITVYNLAGQLLLNEKVHAATVELPVQGFNKGIYIIRAIDVQNRVFSGKVPVF